MRHLSSQSKLENRVFAHFQLPELPRKEWSGSDRVLCNNILIRSRHIGPQTIFKRRVPRRFMDLYLSELKWEFSWNWWSIVLDLCFIRATERPMWDMHMLAIWLWWICDMCQGGKVVGQFGILDAVNALIDIIQLGSTQKALPQGNWRPKEQDNNDKSVAKWKKASVLMVCIVKANAKWKS